MQPQTPDATKLIVGSNVEAIESPVDVVGRSSAVKVIGPHRIIEIVDTGANNGPHVRVAEIKEDGTVGERVPALFHLSSFRAATA